jgi:hypothetical protein
MHMCCAVQILVELFALLLHHVLGVIGISDLNQSFSLSNLVFARNNSWS